MDMTKKLTISCINASTINHNINMNIIKTTLYFV